MLIKNKQVSRNRGTCFLFTIPFLSLFLLVSLFAGASPLTFKKPQEGPMTNHELIELMLKSVDSVKALKYDLKVSERVNGYLKSSESKVKLERSPRKLYLNVNGTEILWLEGRNNGDAFVNPNAFPYINLNLNPSGSLMISNQHHTIYEVGYDYFKDIIAFNAQQAGAKFDEIFLFEGEKKLDGRDTYKITVLNNNFTYVHYIVKKDETLISIARRLRLSEFMIKEYNKGISDYKDVREGQDIMIPNFYAKMTVMYIDKQNLLPILIRAYDDKGLFESYEYLNLQVNPKIAPEEFTKGYKDYHF
jgi:hypothetical protein